MLLLKVLVLIAVLLQMVLATADVGNRKKRAVSYAVEGCFSEFPGANESRSMGGHNSNVRCQDTCRDKGYILAATKGDQCQCGNIYPEGKKVNDTKCTTRCRSWSACHSPQSCCGGPSAYSVSVVGNIDVAKQILRRLSHEWQMNTGYRNYMKSRVNKPSPQSHNDNWWGSFDKQGWSYCGHGRYMTGLYRNDRSDSDGIYRLEEAKCTDAPGDLYPAEGYWDCYNHNWVHSFDHKGWSTCNNGYYMTGLHRSSGHNLYNIEESRCCRPKSQVKSWGSCYNLDVWSSFDRKGWSTCASGYYMAGLYRNSCNNLYCLEEFKCCKMGAYNGDSWVEKPDLVIKVKDTSGQFKRCSMNAMDKSPSSSTYKCEAISDQTNMLELNALRFDIEDKSPLNVGKPRPVKGFRPVTCSAYANSYKCTEWLTAAVSTSSTFKIGTGFSLAVKVGASVEVSAGFLGLGTKRAFSTVVTGTSSFNVEASKTKSYTTKEKTDVSIKVPANTKITINLLRRVQYLEYKWKAIFQLLGKYSFKYANNQEIFEDVTTVLSGSKREMYAFGSWSYPRIDVLRVVITDNNGKKKSGCEHEPGKAKSCKMSAE